MKPRGGHCIGAWPLVTDTQRCNPGVIRNEFPVVAGKASRKALTRFFVVEGWKFAHSSQLRLFGSYLPTSHDVS